MLDLFKRGDRAGAMPDGRRPAGGMPAEVVRLRGKLYLRTVGTAAPDAAEARVPPAETGSLAPLAAGAALPIIIFVATATFMTAFSATFEVATGALAEGSLTAPRKDAARALAIERDQRREALAGYDRRIAGASGNPPLQEAWRDLRSREAETVEQLDRYLDSVGRRPLRPADGDHRVRGGST